MTRRYFQIVCPLAASVMTVLFACGDSGGNEPNESCSNPVTQIVVQVGDSVTGANTFKVSNRCFKTGPGSQVTFRWGPNVGNHSVERPPFNAFPSQYGPITAGPNGYNHVTTTNSTAGIYRFYCIVHGNLLPDDYVAGMADSIIIYSVDPE